LKNTQQLNKEREHAIEISKEIYRYREREKNKKEKETKIEKFIYI